MRHVILFALAFSMTALVMASTVGAGAPRTSCPEGFSTYDVPMTEAELRELPRIAAGLDADPAPYTAGELIDLAQFIDGNEDGTFCLKAISNLRGSSTKAWGYFYGGRDNSTAAS